MPTNQLGLKDNYTTADTVASAEMNARATALEAAYVAALGVLDKSVAGGVDVTLTAAEAANGTLRFTGALTASINVIIPLAAKHPRTIHNDTSGAFTLTVKGPTGTGVAVGQGKHALVRSNGTNVLRVTADV